MSVNLTPVSMVNVKMRSINISVTANLATQANNVKLVSKASTFYLQFTHNLMPKCNLISVLNLYLVEVRSV